MAEGSEVPDACSYSDVVVDARPPSTVFVEASRETHELPYSDLGIPPSESVCAQRPYYVAKDLPAKSTDSFAVVVTSSYSHISDSFSLKPNSGRITLEHNTRA